MTKKDWFGIAYVSIWVLIWGSVGSIIDLPLLNSSVYNAGSSGQFATFAATALLSIIIAILIYPKILSNRSLKEILDLNEHEK